MNETEKEGLYKVDDPFKMNVQYRVFENTNRGEFARHVVVDRTLGVR